MMKNNGHIVDSVAALAIVFNSPPAAVPFDGNKITTSVLTAPSGSAHGPSSTRVTRSLASVSSGKPPGGFTLDETATSYFTAASPDSNNQLYSKGAWLSIKAVSSGAGVTGVWKGGMSGSLAAPPASAGRCPPLSR